jgi:hypothetical protein
MNVFLVEAKLAQSQEFALQETKKSKTLTEQMQTLLTTEHTLRSQITSYSEKFESIQGKMKMNIYCCLLCSFQMYINMCFFMCIFSCVFMF